MDNLEKIEIRKIVPVAAKISSGKSTLLNTLYNINFLECKAGITTKFVNLLRYNPNLKEPIFYHLKLIKKGEEYIFYKDLKEQYKGEKEIIEANKNINKKLYNEKEIDYENIFYMTETNEEPFIKDKNYLLNHDLCDMPGLSEYQSNPNKTNGKEQDKININNEDNFNLFNDSEDEFEDEIYSKTKNCIEHNTYLKEIYEIIKNYIDGGIIIFNIENFYFDENFELIAKLHKIIKKEIINFLIILNKIDLSENPKKDIEKFKGEIIKHFPKCQTFNINLNTFIPLSMYKIQNELLMKNSFRYLIFYHFYNYMEKINKNGPQNITPFINHLIAILKTNEEYSNCTKILEEVSKLNKSENINQINSEIKTIIKDLEEKCKGKEIKVGFCENDFNDNEEDDEEEDDSDDENKKINNNLNKMEPSYIIKIFYIYYKQKKLIPFLSEETNNLLDYFQNKQKEINFNKKINEREINDRTNLNNRMKKKLLLLIDKLKNSKIEFDAIKNLIESINYTVEFLTISDNIFIPFLGASNSGKTTILNGIIGRNILPTHLNECTKRGIIIRYCNIGEEETTIRKVTFSEEKFLNKNNYFLNLGYIIGEGDKQVKEILNDLNYEYTDKEEDCFYYIRTKIKLFDEIGIDESIKRMIYLIDFPGYGMNRKFMKQKMCENIISNSSSFFFILKNSIIKENNTKIILDSIYNQAKVLQKKIYSGMNNLCLFILNNDNSQTTTENDLEIAKKDISEIIKVDDPRDLKLCFYNAKYYSQYCDFYNYCSNIKNTLKMEYNLYLKNKNIIYKFPENYTEQYNSFCDFFNNKLKDKMKNEFHMKMKKNQKIDKNIENDINKILAEFNQLNYINKEEILKNQEKIAKTFSYLQNNIDQIKILKESNIEDFKKLLKDHINYINNELKDKFNKKIDDIISLLNQLFSVDYSKDYYSIKEIKELRFNVNESKANIVDICNTNKKRIWNCFYNCKKEICEIMENRKESIENMGNLNVDEILNQLSIIVERKVKDLNDDIDIILNDTYKIIEKEWEKANKEIINISEKKIQLSKIQDLKEYIKERLGDKNKKSLYQQLYKEIDFNRNLFQIFNNKSFFKALKSIFVDKSYINNHIDIITLEFKENIDIIKIFDISFDNYLRKIIISMSRAIEIATINFSKEHLPIWEEIKEFYHLIEKEIKNIKNEIYQNETLE